MSLLTEAVLGAIGSRNKHGANSEQEFLRMISRDDLDKQIQVGSSSVNDVYNTKIAHSSLMEGVSVLRHTDSL